MLRPLLDGSAVAPITRHDAALLDLDGVLYVGANAVPGAAEAVAQVRAAGVRVAFVTNNASRTPQTVAAHLTDLGITAVPDDVVTSAQAAATLVAAEVAPHSAVLAIGGEGLHSALAERGLRAVQTMAEHPAAVVQGFSPDVGWRLLAEGTYGVRAGLPWIASNMDVTVPTAQGLAPGNGALVGVIVQATGKRPVVAGKPERALHFEAVRRMGANCPIVVGDRLDTDIEGANRAGVDSLLVLTGVTTPYELVLAAPQLRPSYVSSDLGSGLLQPHPPVDEPGSAGEDWRCGGWASLGVAADGDIDLTGAGDPLDAVRVICAAVWGGGDTIDPAAVRKVLSRLAF